jgi:octaprenyl-diphosphate synthase
MTLPLIFALSKATKKDRKRIIRIVKTDKISNDQVQEVIDFVIQSGGIKYASDKMYEYRDQALKILNEFPENNSRNSLRDLVLYTSERKK